MAKKSNRRFLREKALQILYAYELNGDNLSKIIDYVLDSYDNQDREFCIKLVNSVIRHKSDLEEIIIKKVSNWEVERIALIDRLLLRIGIAEILYFPDIPPKVSMNEMIEISKEYSTAKSGKFINGILDAILSDIKKNGKLNKSGRGLIERSFSKKS
ncbi:hypothetical protein BMS3Abin04_00293 [bacterium BMS3Abin04]|nr:hypothetical protein BMS3Abin04_00293 [bacterium BMS3Abin04]